jgi:hypothetical protein
MSRHAAALFFAVGGLLLTPVAAGLPNVPGDPTPPVVTPLITGTLGLNGWYTTNVTVNWSVTDPESIILSTTGCNAVTFTGNTTGTTLTCSAESDGGTATVSKTLRVDKTAPATTATTSRAADSNGWYNHALSIDFNGTDATSGLASCSPDASYGGPDTAAGIVSGTCQDQAGNTAPANLTLKYDASAPQITATPSRTANATGWYNAPLSVTFSGTDPVSGLAFCVQPQSFSGPDTATASVPGSCTDTAGNIRSTSFPLKYDGTKPQATATPSRPPNGNGWFNAALTVAFAGGDATSGIGSCDLAKTYSTPDAANASLSGTCVDRAGNESTPAVYTFKYDSTPPSIFGTTATHGNRSARISWRKSSDTKFVEVFRTPGRNGQGESEIYRGTATGVRDTGLVVGKKYEYQVIGVDEAANRAQQKISLIATGPLLSPTPGLRITMKSPPTLVWAPAKGATYYNVQLIRAGRKVLSAWPVRPSFRLRRTWLYKGRRYRLEPGVYRWYVWPGYGRISAARYAKRPLGSSSFVVTE